LIRVFKQPGIEGESLTHLLRQMVMILMQHSCRTRSQGGFIMNPGQSRTNRLRLSDMGMPTPRTSGIELPVI